MSLLLKNGLIVNATKIERKDILIEEGRISKIGSSLTQDDKKGREIDLKGIHVFPGFIDLHVHLRDPGQEKKESIATGLSAAVHGGITAVCSMPNTKPVIDNEFLVKFQKDKAWEVNKAKLYPLGSITINQEGEQLSEMVSMMKAGAVAFSDDGYPLSSMLVLRRALQYLKPYNVPLILHCEDSVLTNKGSMNEGYTSMSLGLPGIHAASEEVGTAASIECAKYFGYIHIAHVSTKGSVDLIRFAKERGIKITAEAAPHHFSLTDERVGDYDTYAKMSPPLRSEEDRLAIIEGLRDGTLDAIATDHAPHTYDEKNQEFDKAPFGIIGLETAVMLTIDELVHKHQFSLEQIAKIWSTNPANIINVKSGVIKKGAIADLTIIDINKKWQVKESQLFSRSKNSPFIGLKGKGRAVRTIVNGQVVWEDQRK